MIVPRVSVVVPFYNNEDLLGDCLASIAGQTLAELDVIMVDDGSTDGSVAIAQARAAADPRFRLMQVPNGGPGYARNRGIEQARAEFLAFADADDLVLPHAYEHMLRTLESTGSDFVCGNVERIGPAGITQSALHARAMKGTRLRTHVSRAPYLLFDISVFNKLFRKSFWDGAGLSFPEGMLWEDLQAMTRAHVLAKSVDVIAETVYLWRERGKGALSITQSRTDIGNFTDRITALLAIDAFLRQRGTPKLLRQHQRKALVNDLWLYVGELSRTSDAFRAEFVNLVQRYLRQVSGRVLYSLPAEQKLAYHLIARGRLDLLIQFDAWRLDQPVGTVPIVREHGRIRADMPFRKDRALRIPARVYRPHWRELDPVVRVDGVTWQRNRLVITGAAFVPSIDIGKRQYTSKVVVLWPRTRLRPPIVVPASATRYPDAALLMTLDPALIRGKERYSYDWAGFRCEIPARLFKVGARWLTGDWDALILVRGHGVWRAARLHTPLPGRAERPEVRQVAPGIRFGAWWVRRQLHVGVAPTPAVLTGCRLAGDELTLHAEVELPGSPGTARLELARPKGGATRQLTGGAERIGRGKLRVTGTVALTALLGETRPPDGESSADEPAVEWDLYLVPAGQQRIRVAFPAGQPEYRYPSGTREIAVERTRYGNVVLIRRSQRLVIDEHAWSQDGRLTLRGSYPVAASGTAAAGYEAVLRRRMSTDQQVIPVEAAGGRFTISINATAMPSFGRLLPLRDGIWDIGVRPAGAPGAEPVPPGYEHSRLAEVADRKVTFGHKTYRFSTSGYDNLIIEVTAALKLAEQGRVQRRLLRGVYYPMQLKRPLRDSVLFISWKGKQCGDNPLGIAAELRRRGDDRQHVWAVNDWSVPVPAGARAVLAGTEDYFEALARSRWVIANDDMPAVYLKRDGQIYVQTWHGTPLKKIGFDISQPQFISGTAYFDQLAQDVAKWDLLLSPNPFSTSIMRRAFRFAGEIYESGYPRNDVLHSGDAAASAAQVRQRVGVPPGKRVVLYAPTWRDNQYYASGRYRFDFRLDLERAWRMLGDDYVFLIRGHHHMADDVPAGARPGFAVNVTSYPDIAELFLISDVLLTDYSSAICDFAATGKPVVLFAYDLESYRDDLRGFYIDFEAEAPGPLLASTEEVATAIADLDAVAARYARAYAAFAAKYCPLDDGKAGARAVDRIFGS
jgi:CDP-glycerol glycerophosphotransferase